MHSFSISIVNFSMCSVTHIIPYIYDRQSGFSTGSRPYFESSISQTGSPASQGCPHRAEFLHQHSQSN